MGRLCPIPGDECVAAILAGRISLTIVLNLILVAVVLALPALWLAAAIDVTLTSADDWRVAGRIKGPTVALVWLTGAVGAVYYWAVIRPRLRRCLGLSNRHSKVRSEINPP